MKNFIDATIFMGMHSTDETIRIACKNFFIEHLKKTIFMSLENVGKCDDIVWQSDREIQDNYYPFMDRIHTIMNLQRLAYDQRTLASVESNTNLTTLQSLTVAQSKDDILFTFDDSLLGLKSHNIQSPTTSDTEKQFTVNVEELYQPSLQLRIATIG